MGEGVRSQPLRRRPLSHGERGQGEGRFRRSFSEYAGTGLAENSGDARPQEIVDVDDTHRHAAAVDHEQRGDLR